MEGLIFGVLRYIGVYYKRYGFFSRFGLMKTDQLIRVSKRVPFSMEPQEFINVFLPKNLWINLGFLGNCPPTPPLSHHFALSEK